MSAISARCQGLFGWLGRFGVARAPAGVVLPVRLGGSRLSSINATPSRAQGFDEPLVWVTVALLLWGLVMVYSASIAMPENPRFARYTHTYFLVRHAMWLVIALAVALMAYQVPLARWEKLARPLFLFSLLLLAVVLIPHVGKVVYGARRWISVGPLSFQPSELAKFTVLLYAADYMVRKMDVKERFFRAVLPMGAAVAVVGVLLLAEPDMGAFMVIAVIAMGILFLGGVNARMFSLITAVLLVAFSLMIATSEFRRERIFAYLDPWSEHNALAKGYQLTHALIAIGRGEIFGVGLGGSVEKLNWLPEAHTDFLLAVIGEEFGLIGVVTVICLFFWLVRRMMVIGRQSIALDRVFAGLVAQGVAIWMGFQAFINMGVNLGALPTKGLTLPLMSYGGSAILVNLIAIAVVLRVDQENRTLMHGGRV
ncbi:MAG: putative lipid II flippase FtsW [Comamonadaceae bacterium CG_4_9_14_3_um_filter_60_33]|nr:MAG: putative lipid II flippase FtsW [Comamonadaceae bacterium CG2_30_59_20]PIY29554.1 MAG: putative lipid II flippase FtsW [Comamonadaceae bacterium CG_4_10_14_3_um_filter_60_42]PJB46359.1 MAG: putative lipid II flippase FtsW [Comamonadaceae bacterium CG_4_9_14_3_um_filter_60_33]